MLERDSIPKGLSFSFSPPHVGYSLAQEPDHERILALDLERISGEKLRHPVCDDLLELFSGHRLEAAQKLRAAVKNGLALCFLFPWVFGMLPVVWLESDCLFAGCTIVGCTLGQRGPRMRIRKTIGLSVSAPAMGQFCGLPVFRYAS